VWRKSSAFFAEIGMFASVELITFGERKVCFCRKKKIVSVFFVYVIHLPEKVIALVP
jgi:hypothetical protein